MNNNHQVLIVDDNQINRTYFSMSLQKSGFQTSLAENGKQAIKLCKQQKFDVILMDIRMPDLNGSDTAQIIQQNTINQNTPIIATSAEKISENTGSLFVDFILKPISPTELSQKINQFCLNHFNRQSAMSFAFDDQQIMKKLIKLFIIDLPIQVDLIIKSFEANELQKAKDLIHKLRGSCKTCGAEYIDQTLEQLHSFIENQKINNTNPIFKKLNESKNSYLEIVQKIVD